LPYFWRPDLFAKEGIAMARDLLSDDAWECVEDLFSGRKSTGRPPSDRRTVLNGIFWVLRTGSPWRDLPAEFGPWQTVWRLFDKWNSEGLLSQMLKRFQAAQLDADLINSELWCIDGTIVRAARCAAGGGKKGIPKSRPITLSAAAGAAFRRRSTSCATRTETPSIFI
jgi:transposase